METLLEALRGAAEPTRLRLLSLCSHGELTVTELTQILGQSQPRISRHLKLLCEAGLLDRLPEGSWAFYRQARDGRAARLAQLLVDLVPYEDSLVQRDLERLNQVRRTRAETAANYFRDNAKRWDEIRSLYVDDKEVERVLLDLLPPQQIEDLLDIGTGTGRILEVYGRHGVRAVGIDLSREMLIAARANIARAGLRNCFVRYADMYHLPWAESSFDAITVFQVLHYADEPAEAITEAARVLRPGGRLLVADFAPHELDYLRRDHAHRRLGFADDEIAGWMQAAGLRVEPVVHLPGHKITLGLWLAQRPKAEKKNGADG
ncbi:MAG: metalloregulator ArsR/SmtB family transcription factor [Proteobacteria bacterium]|nr:metalloregulator ArsR/SmtB family transcription factor [Pseudomonadota bacterium]